MTAFHALERVLNPKEGSNRSALDNMSVLDITFISWSAASMRLVCIGLALYHN